MTDTTTAREHSGAFLAGPDDPVPAGWVRSDEIGARSGIHVVFDPAVHDVSVVIGEDRETDDVYAALGYTVLRTDGRVSVRVRDHVVDDNARDASARLARFHPPADGFGCER